jgi:hypothetical protein
VEGVDLTKVKNNYSRDSWRNPFEINNEGQDNKIGTMWRGTYGMGRGSERDEGEGIWLMDLYTYMK